jgi:hypothetical protein
MKQAGQIVLFRFPQTDLEEGKLRPALLLGKLPGAYDDWLDFPNFMLCTKYMLRIESTGAPITK